MSKDIVFNQRIVIKNPSLIKCYCNDGGNCLKNKTCETEGFCYQRLIIQNKNGKTSKKLIKGCSSSKQIEFYYCTHSSNKTHLKCCSNNFCNNQPMDIVHYNLKEILHFLLVIIFAVALSIMVTILIKKHIRKRRKKKKELLDAEKGKNSNKPRLYNQIEIVSSIKQGKFKETFYGHRLGEKLFIKIFKEKARQNWLNEVEIFSLPLIRHENIVDFVGKDNLLIVTLFYEIGSLTNFLKANRNLNENQIIRLMLSAAQGLNHLHQDLEFKPSIVHRNLNSDNYVVSMEGNELKCKLTNFSNALTYTKFEKLEKEMKLKQLKEPVYVDVRYYPPEYFNQKINYKSFISFQAADTYSFSLILWQIANHQEDNQENNQLNQFQDQFSQTEQSDQLSESTIFEQNNLSKLEKIEEEEDKLDDLNQKDSSEKEESQKTDIKSEYNENEQKKTEENNLEKKTIKKKEDEDGISEDVQSEAIQDNRSAINSINEENLVSNNNQNEYSILESRYLKPYEEYLMHDKKRSEDVQMKELLIDDSFITRPTIYFDASKVRTFNGYVIPKLIDESWSFESSSRLSIARIVKDLTNLYNCHLMKINKN